MMLAMPHVMRALRLTHGEDDPHLIGINKCCRTLTEEVTVLHLYGYKSGLEPTFVLCWEGEGGRPGLFTVLCLALRPGDDPP